MTRPRRNRDAVAPSLFPFLAVLLCTMGALVLILMLIVSGAQASTRRTTQAIEQEIEVQEAALEIQQRSLRSDFEEGQIEVEKKRLALQGIENHIQETLDELSQLAKTDALLEADETAESEADDLRKMSELEKQLADAKSELLNRTPKPAGEKPIFAIIPYDGRNGTHRRPIYLECVDDKLVIQPEGVELSNRDLQPPYGPGNPLDAALRTIRSEYVPANGAVTSTAYPLLVVRPSGVLAYARARQAMSGWDDQFGYELIDEELELAFPDSKPGLKQRIASSLSLARERQAAIAMAMPRSYRGAMDFSGGSGVRAEPTSYSGSGGQGGTGRGGARGGFSAASPGDGLAGVSGSEVEAILDGVGGFGSGGASQSRANQTGGAQSGISGSQFDSNSLLAMSGSQSGGDNTAYGQSVFSDAAGESLGGQSGSSEYAGSGGGNGSASGSPSSSSSSNSSSQTGVAGGSNGFGQANAAQPGSPGGASGGVGSMQAGGEQVGIPTFGLTANLGEQGGQPSSSANGQQAASRAGQPPGGNPSQSGTSSRRSSGASKSRSGSGGSQGGSGNQTQSVASSRGRDWAWSGDNRTLTPVSRSIRLVCTTDAWILPASRSSGQPVAIRYDTTPVQRAEKLAALIRQKVDSWGYALDGGYWKPELIVEVGPGAQWRYEQLQRLFESSGLRIIAARSQPTGATTLPRRTR